MLHFCHLWRTLDWRSLAQALVVVPGEYLGVNYNFFFSQKNYQKKEEEESLSLHCSSSISTYKTVFHEYFRLQSAPESWMLWFKVLTFPLAFSLFIHFWLLFLVGESRRKCCSILVYFYWFDTYDNSFLASMQYCSSSDSKCKEVQLLVQHRRRGMAQWL